jgi:hydrogenase expression/formation protein HypC
MVEGYGDQLALVDVEGASRKVNIGLLDPGAVGPGDWVLIHMGFAVERVDQEQAEKARAGLEMLGRPADDSDTADDDTADDGDPAGYRDQAADFGDVASHLSGQ